MAFASLFTMAANATETVSTDPIKAAISTGQAIGEAGPWGAFGLALCAAVYFFKQYRDEARARLADQKIMAELIGNNTLATQTWVTANEERNRVFKASVESQQLSVAQLTTNGLGIASVLVQITSLDKELGRTREALIAKGHISP